MSSLRCDLLSSIWARYYEKTFLCFQFLIRLYTRILFRQGFPISFSSPIAIGDNIRFGSSCEIVDIYSVLQPSMMESLSVEVVLVVVVVVVVIVVHCLDDVKSGTQILCSQSSIRFVAFKTVQDSTQNTSPFHNLSYPFVFFPFFSYFFSLPIFIVSMTFEVSIAPMFQELTCHSLNQNFWSSSFTFIYF